MGSGVHPRHARSFLEGHLGQRALPEQPGGNRRGRKVRARSGGLATKHCVIPRRSFFSARLTAPDAEP